MILFYNQTTGAEESTGWQWSPIIVKLIKMEEKTSLDKKAKEVFKEDGFKEKVIREKDVCTSIQSCLKELKDELLFRNSVLDDEQEHWVGKKIEEVFKKHFGKLMEEKWHTPIL